MDEIRRHAFFSTSQTSTSLPLSALTRTPNVSERPMKKTGSARFKHPVPPADKRKHAQIAMEKKHEEDIQQNLVSLCQDIEMSLSFGRLSMNEGIVLCFYVCSFPPTIVDRRNTDAAQLASSVTVRCPNLRRFQKIWLRLSHFSRVHWCLLQRRQEYHRRP